MPTITETTDANELVAPIYSMNVEDTFDGFLNGSDSGDNVAINLNAGLTYTLVLTGLGELDSYNLSFISTGLSGQVDSEEYQGGISGLAGLDIDWAEGDAGSGQLSYTFVADDTGEYWLTLDRTGLLDGNIDYELTVHHGAVDAGSEGNDTIRGALGDQGYDMLAGDDYGVGGRGNDTFLGGDGDDTIYSGKDQDVVNGGAGNDFIAGMGGHDLLEGGDDDDRISGGAGVDTIDGGDGNDTIFGNKAADLIFGGAGDDSIRGGTEEDTIDGGEGNDSLDGEFGLDVYVFSANSGDDTIAGFSDGFDRIDVTGINIFGLGDMLFSQSGSDVLIDFQNGSTVLVEDAVVADFDDNDFLYATLGTQGTSGDDTMVGTAGDDWFVGLAGDDLITGDIGDDLLEGGDDRDTIDGGADNDTILGGNGNDSIDGGAGNDSLDGGNSNDTMHGGAGNDLLIGGSGKDSMYGDAGDDTLMGGTSIDVLEGGAGFDVFVFESNANDDFITDFEDGVDLIDISALITAGDITGFGDLVFSQIGNNVRITLYGSNDLTILTENVANLTIDDFIIA